MTARSAKTLKLAAAALALVVAGAAAPALVAPAEAKPIAKGGHHHPHFGRFIVGGLALAGTYEASRSCYWLKVRALRTDSEYWWDRYHSCIGD